jgi:hypothetical protein
MRKLLLCVVLIAASFTSIAQVGIGGTTTPDASAALEIESTTKGFLLPRMTLVQINAIATPAEGLMVYCLDCSTKGLFVNNGTEFINSINGNGMVIELISFTGKRWMDRNLGATQVAASSTHAASYGDLYQWGRPKDGHESRTSSTITTTAASATAGHGNFITASASTNYNWTDFAGEDTLWQSGLNDPCPAGYRVPTEPELQNEITAFSSNLSFSAVSQALKLPRAGYRNGSNGTIYNVGSNGNYWSSTVRGASARLLYFSSSAARMYDDYRAFGFSVRCIKD